MGIFDSIKKMLNGEPNRTPEISPALSKASIILSPASGLVTDLANVPDPVFSEKAVGDGFAIDLTDAQIIAPFDGTITKLFHTFHAFVIESHAGVEIMIHIGLDTVQLNGEGFTPKVKQGDPVKAGDVILELDLDFLRTKAKSLLTPVLLLNEDEVGAISNRAAIGQIQKGDVLYHVGAS